jgi:hypothetical protein
VTERFGVLTADVALKGLIAESSLMSGAFIPKRLVLRLEANVFRVVREGSCGWPDRCGNRDRLRPDG